MDLLIIILIALAVIAVAGIVYWAIVSRRRSRLRERFGPEYDRMVEQRDDRKGAESELAMREKRRNRLDIRPLRPEARDEYARRWRETQARFVDEPGPAVGEADSLVQEVMRERGYPVEDFSQRESDLSVDHPTVLENYRAAHGISLAQAQGQATTEDLRQAMVHYRTLFVELLEVDASGSDRRPGAPHVAVDRTEEEAAANRRTGEAAPPA
jgi:FtsZ-interacting cell division protein ZipA